MTTPHEDNDDRLDSLLDSAIAASGGDQLVACWLRAMRDPDAERARGDAKREQVADAEEQLRAAGV